MTDFIATFGLHLAIIAVFIAALRLFTKEAVSFRPILIAIPCLGVYWTALFGGLALQHHIPALAELDWNWTGKILAIIATSVMIWLVPDVTPGDAGMTLRQRKGSLIPVVMVITLLCTFSWGLQVAFGDGPDLSAERLAYQATMPGLDEELFSRGLLLALLLRGFDERWTLAGAPVGPAALIITFLFGAGHGLQIADGAVHFDALTCAVTGLIGFGLLWLRQRSGSLIAPILGHNLVNFGASFF